MYLIEGRTTAPVLCITIVDRREQSHDPIQFRR